MSATQFQFLPNTSPEKADIVILPVPYESTVSYKTGTAAAPEAILRASGQLEYYEEDAAWSPLQHMNICVLDAFQTDNNESEATTHQRLHDIVNNLNQNNLLIALGGEHSITPDLVSARIPKPGTIVQLDAHADLRPHYQGSIYNHACPMHRLREQGHDLIMIGIRSLFESEAERINTDENITAYMDRHLRSSNAWPPLLKHLESLEGDVWLTIDMDAFDPGLVPGVGTPQPGGLSWHQALDILESLIYNPRINFRGMDIVELTPDANHVSEITAAKLIQKALSFWGKSKGHDQRPKTGSQSHVDYH